MCFLAMILCAADVVQGFSSLLVSQLQHRTDLMSTYRRTPFGGSRVPNYSFVAKRQPCLSGSRGLFAKADSIDADEVKWLPIISGPSVEPTPGTAVIPIFPLGATVYVVRIFCSVLFFIDLIYPIWRSPKLSTRSIYLNRDTANYTTTFCSAGRADSQSAHSTQRLGACPK